MKLVSRLSDGYWEKEVDEFLGLLTRVSMSLEILAQIQASVGGLSMEARAAETFRMRATMDNMLLELIEERNEEKKAKGETP